MDYALSDQGQKARTDLSEHINAVAFREGWPVVSDDFREISITKLYNDIVIPGTFEDIVEANDMLVLDTLQNFDLIFKRGHQIIIAIDFISDSVLKLRGIILTATGS